MTALDLGALVALGFVSSTHCLAMCSAFVLCVGRRSPAASVSYQLGRLVSYSALGALLGVFGLGVRLASNPLVSRAVLIVAGTLMIAIGLVQEGALRMPALGSAGVQRALSRLLARPSALAPLGLGLFTGLLPCPMLFAALLRSVASASPLDGALGMAAFWLGTLPAMGGLTLLGPLLRSRGVQWWPRLALAVTVVLGAVTLYRGLAFTGGCAHCAL